MSEEAAVVENGRSRWVLLSGAALVLGVIAVVATGLYALTEGKIAEDPSRPTAATLAAVQRVVEQDPERGRRIQAGMEQYRHSCRLCHHRTGRGGIFTPSLRVHNAASVLAMLELYRSGATVGPMTDLMAPWAKELTGEEMHNLAEYIGLLASVDDTDEE